MSRATRLAKDERLCLTLERNFRERLIDALKECAEHRVYGLFGQNDAAFAAAYGKIPERYRSKKAEGLAELGNEIDALRARLGSGRFPLYHRYLWYRSRRGPNDPGEPKLAAELLAELEALGVDSPEA